MKRSRISSMLACLCLTYSLYGAETIRVGFNQTPEIICPPDTLIICDTTANDANFWNEIYWLDVTNQIKNLPETTVDISITAKDLSSGDNLTIEYELYLDLNNDGIQETLVKSTELGEQSGGLGWDNVLYNNLNGPGESRHFDRRAVLPALKYGFAKEETVSGVERTAIVKFNTFTEQNSFVNPQLPHGKHKVVWIVKDGQGNESTCAYDIQINDCEAPMVECLNGLHVNIMPFQFIQLWATDFLNSVSDNFTYNPFLKFAIRKCGEGTGFPLDINGSPQTNIIYDCTELGDHCIELWALDGSYNADYCQAQLSVGDTFCNCECSMGVSVAGNLMTWLDVGIEEAKVSLTGTVNFAPPFSFSDISTNMGVYDFLSIVPVGANFTITPSKNDNPLNGVTTYDLVLVSKHILGVEPLGDPLKMIAADVNHSGSITTFDIVETRKLILGIYQEFNNNTAWRFIDKDQIFSNPQNPFTDTLRESISVTEAVSNMLDLDFWGIKTGDVNYSAVANSFMSSDDRSIGTFYLDIDNREIVEGEMLEVKFNTSNPVQAFQATLNINGLQVVSVENSINVNAQNFAVFSDALTLSIDGAASFTIRFRALKSGNLSDMLSISSRITKAVAYDETGEPLDIALRFNGTNVTERGFELYQNNPNPFANSTEIGFYLPEASSTTLSVFDQTGRLVYEQKQHFDGGDHAFYLDSSNFPETSGLYCYRITTEFGSSARMMMQSND